MKGKEEAWSWRIEACPEVDEGLETGYQQPAVSGEQEKR